MPRPSAVALALCLLAVVAIGTAGIGVAKGGAGTSFALGQGFDRTQFDLTVFGNGSARWTFHYERTLDNQSQVQEFTAYADTFNHNDTRLYRDFRNQSVTLARRGANATNRPMAATSFAKRAFVTTQLNEVGVVELSFTWTGFAPATGDRVVVGDVFEGGLYIGPHQELVVHAGPGLAFQSVEPSGTLSGGSLATSDSVTWSGERTFADNHPRVVLVPAGSVSTATATAPPNGGETPSPRTGTPVGPSRSGGPPLWPLGLVLAVIVVAVGAFIYQRRSPSSGGAAATTGGGGDGGPAAPAIDETALLDDEERISRLLTEHGGRMRQSAIVEATGWSKSKVSMVLSEMAEADAVRKLRVGRENIISLPGHEPDAVRSPHEDVDEGR